MTISKHSRHFISEEAKPVSSNLTQVSESKLHVTYFEASQRTSLRLHEVIAFQLQKGNSSKFSCTISYVSMHNRKTVVKEPMRL